MRYKYGSQIPREEKQLVGGYVPQELVLLFRKEVKKRNSTVNFEIYKFVLQFCQDAGLEVPERYLLPEPDGAAQSS